MAKIREYRESQKFGANGQMEQRVREIPDDAPIPAGAKKAPATTKPHDWELVKPRTEPTEEAGEEETE